MEKCSLDVLHTKKNLVLLRTVHQKCFFYGITVKTTFWKLFLSVHSHSNSRLFLKCYFFCFSIRELILHQHYSWMGFVSIVGNVI